MIENETAKKNTLPEFLPHGWKGEVAEILGIHRNTIRNALIAGKGETYERIRKIAIIKWGDSKNKT